MDPREPNVALVHDHLTQDGGAERVLRVLADLFPHAPVYTLAYKPDRFNPPLTFPIRTSFLDRAPFSWIKFEWTLPLMPLATELHALREHEVVVSSVSSMAKGIITHPNAVHICYCHTPTRYLWTEMHEYVERLALPRLIKRILPWYLSRLRQWDRAAADRVDVFVANSATVRDRIKKFYRRDAVVVYPPVEVHRFAISDAPKTYFLAGGRLMAYKQFDLIVDTFRRLNLPLIIFGDGPLRASLEERATPNIRFVGRVSDQEQAHLYANCIAYLHPQEEDFGMTAVEAMATGRPVIAYGKGGATETVVDGITGTFFYDQNFETLADVLIRFRHESFDPATIRAHAQSFSTDVFSARMRELVADAYAHRH